MKMKDYVIILERRIQSLEDVAHEPQNYKEKCDQMEERIKVLEDKRKKDLYKIEIEMFTLDKNENLKLLHKENLGII